MSEKKHIFNAKHVAVIGLGLIGGSVARGIYRAGFRGELVGAVENEADVKRALTLGLVDACHADIARAVAKADLIVVAVPPAALAEVLAQIAAHAPRDAIITDTGSSKQSVVALAQAHLADRLAYFVPGHPIAGTENQGLDAGFNTLFDGRRVILTPSQDTAASALDCVVGLWKELGASVIEMDAAHHDDVLAATSHLPHVLAYTLVDTLAALSERQEIFAFAAGGFADFTRIASSDARLWRDIVVANRGPVLDVLDTYIERLARIRSAIADDDHATIDGVFGRAKAARDEYGADRRETTS